MVLFSVILRLTLVGVSFHIFNLVHYISINVSGDHFWKCSFHLLTYDCVHVIRYSIIPLGICGEKIQSSFRSFNNNFMRIYRDFKI